MGRENNIVRTTIYLNKYLHSKAVEAQINVSKEVANYLETILFGDEVSDVNYQLTNVEDRIKKLNIELTALNARKKKLLSTIKQHDSKMIAEKSIYNKFLKHLENIKSNIDKGHGVDHVRLGQHWRQDYFPDNGVQNKTVENVMVLVMKDKFDYDVFQKLRRGDVLEGK